MFCESCDVVFCVDCSEDAHNRGGASAHTIIPFSIAIKRMSEILLYKASLCIKNLDGASEVVADEMSKLDDSAERCVEMAVKVFQDIANIVEQRKLEVIQMVRMVRDEKKRILKEQLDIIESEKHKVHADCQGLQHQVEVRNITAKIGDLNEKLDVSATLIEPRENAFMRFESRHNTAMLDISNALSRFGTITISKTFPALCTVSMMPCATTHLKTVVTISTVDYHGNARTTGGDPVVANMSNNTGDILPADLIDNNNGTYTLMFTPKTTGPHRLSVYIFDRPIKDSPFSIEVDDHINPIIKMGSTGTGQLNFKQPVNIVLRPNGRIYILDTGNSRIKVVDSELKYISHICGAGLEQHSTTGMALTSFGNLVVANWRTKQVTELTPDGEVVQQFVSPKFVEPIAVTANRHGEIIIADNGIGMLLVFETSGSPLTSIGCKGDKRGQFKLIYAVYACSNDDIIVCDTRLQVFSRAGDYLHEISSGQGVPGTYGGVCMDRNGQYLATRVEKGRSVIQVFSPTRQWLFDIDSVDDKIKRPSGLVTDDAGHVYVVDLGNDCVKKYWYI